MNLTRIANILFICFIASITLHQSLAAPTRDPDLDDDSDIDLGDTSELTGEESLAYPSTSYEYSYEENGDNSYDGDSYDDDDYSFESYFCDNQEQELQTEQLCDRVRDCEDGSDEFYETCIAHGREVDNEDDFTQPWIEPTEVATTTAQANTQQSETTLESEERNAGTGDYEEYYDDFDYDDCLEDEYQCPDYICVPRAALCDGYYDCSDGADEENCHGNQEETTLDLPTVMTVTTTRSSRGSTFAYATTPQMTTAAQVATTTVAPLITDPTDDAGSADYAQTSPDVDETTTTWRPQETTGQDHNNTHTTTTHVDTTTITSEDTRKTGYETSTPSPRTISTTKIISPETTTMPVVTQQTETASSSTFTTEPTSLSSSTPEHPSLATTETNHKYATTTEVMTNNAPTTTFPTTTTTTATVSTTSRIPESTFTESVFPTPIANITAGPQSTSSETHYSDLCAAKDRFQCRSRVGDCISRDALCDGFIDCDDGSDEADCSCKRGSDFECINNRCIDAALRCDGYDDCGDMSDEIIGCIIDPGIRIVTRPEVTQTTENHFTQTNTYTQTSSQTSSQINTKATTPMAPTSSTAESHEEPGMSIITLCPSGYTCFNGGTCSWSNRGEETCQCPEGITGNYCERIVVEGDLEKNIDIPSGSATSTRLNSLKRIMLILVIILSVAIICGVNML